MTAINAVPNAHVTQTRYSGKLLRASNKTMVLQEADPRVTLTFLPHLDPRREKSPLLDLSNPDDCHIEEALAFRAIDSGIRTAILTHDTGPMLTAERVGLEPLEIPDAWLLEPEKDELRKQIEELTSQDQMAPEPARPVVVCCSRRARGDTCGNCPSITEDDHLHPTWSRACWPICATAFPDHHCADRESADDEPDAGRRMLTYPIDEAAIQRLTARRRNQLFGCMHAHNELSSLNRPSVRAERHGRWRAP